MSPSQQPSARIHSRALPYTQTQTRPPRAPLDVMSLAGAGGPPFRAKEKRGLLGLAEPSLMHGGRTRGENREAFVAFDTSKTKHAVAIADGGRGDEVRFLGEISRSPAAVERPIGKLPGRQVR